jgi:type I restriction-modification system DNA methylase subunit
MSSYSELTLAVTAQLSKQEKKEYGFFVTPPVIIDQLLARIETLGPFAQILEPSCGTCEIVSAASRKFPEATIVGIEYNNTVYDSIKHLATDQIQLIHTDFINGTVPERYYDLIIGNPPYFVCLKELVPKKYHPFMVGRPNMFGVFILRALDLLAANGILAFVIPKSFMNSAFYNEIRKHIRDTCRIISIIDFEDDNEFLDTDQATFGLIVQKNQSTDVSQYSIQMGDQCIFTEDAARLRALFEGATTLNALGYAVKTGTVVWNQYKTPEEVADGQKKKLSKLKSGDISPLTDDATKTLLIYNTNIQDGEIVERTFSNAEKKQYIDLPGSTETCIVVNRGNGNSAYNLTYALVEGRTYLVENHLNQILYDRPTGKPDYKAILRSFQDPRTKEFLQRMIGNGGLSKTELETIIPIYL